MSVSVVKFKPEGLKATVVIQAEDFAKAASSDAKKTAIEEATKHLGLCGISGSSGPYPVDDNGNELDFTKMAEVAKSKKKVNYHNEYYIAQSLAL